MREAAQVVSYEVPLGLCVVVPVMIAGTMDLVAIGNMQRGMFWNWFLFHDPFTFLAFCVYFTCAVASVNRAPFDLAEAETVFLSIQVGGETLHGTASKGAPDWCQSLTPEQIQELKVRQMVLTEWRRWLHTGRGARPFAGVHVGRECTAKRGRRWPWWRSGRRCVRR